ncbi:MAG: S41 family peptidase, partial [Planctomycetota bacterium]
MARSTRFTLRLNTWGVLAVLLVCSGLRPTAGAEKLEPGPRDGWTAKAVAKLLDGSHLSRHPLDDQISERCLNLFLETLDPWKMYLEQSDVDAFMLQKNDLDDQVRRGDTRFAYTVFHTLLERADQRVKLAEELLGIRHDFGLDEKVLIDPDLTRYARSKEEAREKWRKRVKLDLLSLKADGIEGEKAVQKLSRRYRSRLQRLHQTNNDDLLEIFLTALATAFDPHSGYMSPTSAEDFMIDMAKKLEGIGAALGWVDGEIVVTRIVPGGAADKEGRLKVDDRIVGVGQGPDGEIEDVVGAKDTEVVRKIRGEPGTVVRLEVTSPDRPERRTIEITRARVELKDSEAQCEIFEENRKAGGPTYKIGVVYLPSFYRDVEAARQGLPDYNSATRDVRRILQRFSRERADAAILDLRHNGGGYLQEAVSLTGLFIDEGPVVQVKTPDGQVQPYHDRDKGVAWNGPLVVLVSRSSASASEILAAAVQDYRRGLVVGDRATHGKGTVQDLVDLSERPFFQSPTAPRYGTLRITVRQFYRPTGDSTQNQGVLADVELPSLAAHLTTAEADLDYCMPFDRVDPLEFKRLDDVDSAIFDRLKQRSSQRCRNSQAFQEIL